MSSAKAVKRMRWVRSRRFWPPEAGFFFFAFFRFALLAMVRGDNTMRSKLPSSRRVASVAPAERESAADSRRHSELL